MTYFTLDWLSFTMDHCIRSNNTVWCWFSFHHCSTGNGNISDALGIIGNLDNTFEFNSSHSSSHNEDISLVDWTVGLQEVWL